MQSWFCHNTFEKLDIVDTVGIADIIEAIFYKAKAKIEAIS